jgi:ABC-2 type transport system permease protein
MTGIRIVWSYWARNFKVERSYKFTLFLQLFAILFSVGIYFFISKLFGHKIPAALASYQTNYFQFALVGLAVNHWLFSLAYSGSSSIGEEMRNGTLDFLLLSPASRIVSFIAINAWRWFYETIIMVVYFLAGYLFFDLRFTSTSWPLFLGSLLLALICFTGLNLISASFLLVFKRGNVVPWVLGSFMIIWGDVYFPLQILPEKIQGFSHLIPLDNIMALCRLALFNPTYSREMMIHSLVVFLWGVVLLTFGTWSFKASLRYALRNGTLSFV